MCETPAQGQRRGQEEWRRLGHGQLSPFSRPPTAAHDSTVLGPTPVALAGRRAPAGAACAHLNGHFLDKANATVRNAYGLGAKPYTLEGSDPGGETPARSPLPDLA